LRNVTLSADATFSSVQRWMKSELPITLPWRSTPWRVTVPALWLGLLVFWGWLVSMETPRYGAILYGLVFVGALLILALAATWWVRQLVSRRIAGSFVINDDYLECQYATESEVDLLTDCGRFELAGKHDRDARIEWDLASPPEGDVAMFGPFAPLLRRFKPDRALYGRDVGLDRNDLDSLCRLLNQLRDEAAAGR
jgi:hypothetical protein